MLIVSSRESVFWKNSSLYSERIVLIPEKTAALLYWVKVKCRKKNEEKPTKLYYKNIV